MADKAHQWQREARTASARRQPGGGALRGSAAGVSEYKYSLTLNSNENIHFRVLLNPYVCVA